MRMTKKVLSIVLAVMMVVSMMSVMAVSANAATGVAEINGTNYETLEAAFAAAHDGDTITVLADCAGNGIKVTPAGKFANQGLTVDFNGHTYTVDGETVGSTGTETNGFQLLKNNKVTFENGTITSTKAKILVQNYSDLTLDKMTLTLNNPGYTSAYTLSDNNGEVVINDTTINANPAGGFAFDVCRYASYPSVNVTVKGASVINGDVEISASGNDAKDGFSLTLEGGEMYGEVITTSSAAAAIATTPEKAKITIEDDFKFYVAQIGDNKYETLEAAFAAAVDGDEITVLADCSGNGIKVPQGKFATGLTVDFAGHTYTVDGTTVGSTGTETQGFQLLKDNKITFKNGTIKGSTQKTATLKFLIQNYSDLTLDKMNLELVGKYYNQYTLSNNNGNIVINDSTINAPTYGGVVRHDVNSYAFDVCRFSSYPSVKVTVTGNSTINGDVEVSASNNDPKNGFSLNLQSGTMTGNIVLDDSAKTALANAPEKASVNKAAGFEQDAPADYKWVDDGKGGKTLAPKEYVAQVGTTKYENLQDALDVVPDGGTVTVLKDITTSGNIFADGYVSGGNRTYTVDLGGYTVSGAIFIVDSGNNVTFKNGTIESATYGIQNKATATVDSTATVKSTATDSSAVFGAKGSTTNIKGTVEGNKYGVIAKGGTLNVAGKVTATDDDGRAITLNEGGTADINDGADIEGAYGVVVHKDATLNVNGGDIAGVYHAVSGNGTAADGPYTINVTGGTLTSTDGSAIYHPNTGDVNISGGNITGSTSAIAIRAGTTTITGGTLKGGTGDAISADNPSGYAALDSISVSGGTFSTPVPADFCATGFQPKDNGNNTYTVEVKDNPLDDVMARLNDGNMFDIPNPAYRVGAILGVQKKSAVPGASVTSTDGAQEALEGDDMRFVAVLNTEVLKAADDYGFVLVKDSQGRTTNNFSNANFDKVKAFGGNGEKTISCAGTSNTICGDYGKLGTKTDYKYITCAVNGVNGTESIVARFYVTLNGKTYYGTYGIDNFESNIRGCAATYESLH